MKLAISIALGTSLIALAACGGGGGGDAVAPGPTLPPGEVPDTLLEGTWESDCFAADASTIAIARRYALSLGERTFTFVDTTYSDALCGEAGAQREIVAIGTWMEQLPEAGRDLADGIPIDFTVEDMTLTPFLSPVVDIYNNQIMLCDAANFPWNAREPRSIANCVDETGTLGVDTTVPRTDPNLFLVDDRGTPDDRSDDRLLLGSPDLLSDTGTRPAAVDAERPFSRRAGSS